MPNYILMRYKTPEPCLCGDPECPRCYPLVSVAQSLWDYEYDDDGYDETLADEERQERLKERSCGS